MAIEWVSSLDVPVWVTDADLRISYMNSRAETLFGRTAADCVGLPCHQVVAATDASGRPFCEPVCRWARVARRHKTIAPLELRLCHLDGSRNWATVLPIAVRPSNEPGPSLVHCALGTNKAHRLEDYLSRVALRGAPDVQMKGQSRRLQDLEMRSRAPGNRLTKREAEILGLLAADRDLRQVAVSLHISYATVRNHVQHILLKLGVHSITEAVAYHVLTTD